MGHFGLSFLSCLLVWWMGNLSNQEAVDFLEGPFNLTSSLGKDVKLSCSVHAIGEPLEVSWLRDGATLALADTNQVQVPLDEEEWLTTSVLRSEISFIWPIFEAVLCKTLERFREFSKTTEKEAGGSHQRGYFLLEKITDKPLFENNLR